MLPDGFIFVAVAASFTQSFASCVVVLWAKVVTLDICVYIAYFTADLKCYKACARVCVLSAGRKCTIPSIVRDLATLFAQ